MSFNFRLYAKLFIHPGLCKWHIFQVLHYSRRSLKTYAIYWPDIYTLPSIFFKALLPMLTEPHTATKVTKIKQMPLKM